MIWTTLEALATTSAVVVALAGIWVEARGRRRAEGRAVAAEAQLATERERADQARAEEAERAAFHERYAQALMVIGWVDRVEVGKAFVSVGGERHPNTENRVTVINGSLSPVFDVEIDVIDRGVGQSTQVGRLPVLAGGSRESAMLSGTLADAADVRARLRFRDLAGRLWVRQQNSQLYETDESWAQIGPIVGTPAEA